MRNVLITAYVSAWKKGCYTLVGVAIMQLVLCAMMRRVDFDSALKKEEGQLDENRQNVVEEDIKIAG